MLRRAVAVSTTDTNQSDPCAIAHDQSQLWRGQTPGPGAAVIDFSSLNEGHGRRHIAFARHLLAFCIAFRCVEGQCLQSLNRPRRDERGGRATVRSADCHRGADAAARRDGHNRFPHPGRIPDRVQPSYQTAVNSSEAVRQSDEQAALTAFNNESGQQPIADLICAMKAAAIRDFLRRIAAAKCIMINEPRSLRQPGLFCCRRRELAIL